MGFIQSLTSREGRRYTVSTAKKFDSWETAVFEGGSLNVMLGRNIRFVEVVLGDDPVRAQLVHKQVEAIAQSVPQSAWSMSSEEIRREQNRAVAYVTSRSKFDDRLTSRSFDVMVSFVAKTGHGDVLTFAERLSALGATEWQQVLRAAELNTDWLKPEHHAVAGPYLETLAEASIAGALVAMHAGQSIARSGLGADANQALVFVSGTAAMAIMARSRLTSGAFAAMWRPFSGVLPEPVVAR